MSCVYLSQSQIVADRPSASASAVTVPEGGVQIESGFAYGEFNKYLKTKEYALPMGLIRYGLISDLELRFAYNITKQSISDFENPRSFESFQFGFKKSVLKEEGLIPDLAFLSHYQLNNVKMGEFTKTDINGSELSEPHLEHTFDIRIAFAYSLPIDFAFGGNLGVIVWEETTLDKPVNSRGVVMSGADTFTRYFDLYQWTANLEYTALDNLAFYSELFGDFKSDEARTDLNVGVKFLATQNMQLDAFYVKVLSLPDSEIMNDDYYQIGFGFSYLWN